MPDSYNTVNKRDKENLIELSVSIVSHNSLHDLELLIPSLGKSLKGISHEILIVDNKSDDGSVNYLQGNYPNIILTKNKKRYGYGKNHNLNLQQAIGKYIVFMNADTIIMPNTFRTLYKFMETNKDVSICTPNVLNKDRSLQYLNRMYPSLLDLFLRRFLPRALKKKFKHRLDYYEMRGEPYIKSMDVPFISGCFMFCRKSVIQIVHGFDEGYFLYFEDIDLCRKVQAFARTVSCPEAEIIHRWERSAHKELKWFIVFVKSAFRYFNKWGYRLY